MLVDKTEYERGFSHFWSCYPDPCQGLVVCTSNIGSSIISTARRNKSIICGAAIASFLKVLGYLCPLVKCPGLHGLDEMCSSCIPFTCEAVKDGVMHTLI